MNSNRQLKEKKIFQIKEIIKNLKTAICFKNIFLNVNSVQIFKKKLKKHNAKATVFKNRLIKKAVIGSKLSDLSDNLKGPLLFIFSNENSLDLIKEVFKFKKQNKKTEVIVGFYENEILNFEELKELSKLRNYSELLQNLCGLLNSPLSNLIFTLEEIVNKIENK